MSSRPPISAVWLGMFSCTEAGARRRTFKTDWDVFWCYDFHGDLRLVLVQHQVLLSCTTLGVLLSLDILIIPVLGIIPVTIQSAQVGGGL